MNRDQKAAREQPYEAVLGRDGPCPDLPATWTLVCLKNCKASVAGTQEARGSLETETPCGVLGKADSTQSRRGRKGLFFLFFFKLDGKPKGDKAMSDTIWAVSLSDTPAWGMDDPPGTI